MTIDFQTLAQEQRLLFAIPLKPLQGQRFQPTGFPNLGAATYQTKEGMSLLVESAQSMANRLELTLWDEGAHDIIEELRGLSHVRVMRGVGDSLQARTCSNESTFFADSLTESHRINSPYIMFAKNETSIDVFDRLGTDLNVFKTGPIPSRSEISRFLFRWDIGSLLHGTFLSAKKGKKNLAGGRLRIARAISCFIEADAVRVAASGGVKNDHVNPSGDTGEGFGNVLFARDEFTADRITLYANIDLAQIRGYGLGAVAEHLLILLSLYKLRALLDGNLRLRTACDLQVDPATTAIIATRPSLFLLPAANELLPELKNAIAICKEDMTVTEVCYNDELLKKDKGEKGSPKTDENDETNEENAGE